MNPYWEHDHWEHDHWEPAAQQPRYYSPRHSGYLSPEPQYPSNLHRSRSQGHVPRAASIHIHNSIPVNQDTHARAESRPPSAHAPMPPLMMAPPMMAPPMMAPPPPLFVPVAPDHHARDMSQMERDMLWRQMQELKLERSRSRSRGRSPPERPDHSELYKYQIDQAKRDAAEAERKRQYEEEKKRMKAEYDLAALKEENKRRAEAAEAAAERQRAIDDYERQKQQDAKKAKEAEEAFKLKLEKQAKEAQEREKKAYEDFMRRQKEQEEEEERKYREYLRRQKEKEEEEERKYQEFLRKQKEKQEAEEKKKKEEDAKINATMRERLQKLGYSPEAIEIMLDPKERKKKNNKHTHHSPSNEIIVVPPAPPAIGVIDVPERNGGHIPVYPRINRAYLDIETLDHYRIPWKFDPANTEFIVILQEMDKYETDVLFEHTARRRRNVKLLIEDKKKEPKYAWVRRRSRSKSVGRKDLRVMEIRKT